MALKHWTYTPSDHETTERLSRQLSLPTLVTSVMVAKGITDPKLAEAFINNTVTFEDPFLIKDMDIAVERILLAVEQQETIAVFGDYDVDGIMSAVMVYLYLESISADVRVLVPDRDAGGYGLAVSSVDDIEELGATLIITVDNGVSSFEAVEYASERGIDTIICDHHIVPETLPNAIAVVNPLRKDDNSSFKKYAGVGVALNLISAVEGCPVEEMMEVFGDLAAIGTVADVVPLQQQNRYIVAYGLQSVKTTANIGLRALIEATNLNLDTLTLQDITYTLIPRLNAAGRMASASLAVEMVLAEDQEVANELAVKLCELNTTRQKVEAEMLENICKQIDRDLDFNYQPILVIAGDSFSSGVSGIVCSKLIDRYAKPTMVISIEPQLAKGSARSVEGFSLYDAINSAADCLLTFGGHDMAAGFTLDPNRIEEFTFRLQQYCRTIDKLRLIKSIDICENIEFDEINEDNVAELYKLAPFGSANEEPIFSSRSVTVKELSPLSQNHSRITFEQNSKLLRAALFGTTPEQFEFKIGEKVDIAYTLSIYTASNGNDYVSVRLRDILPASADSNHDNDYESVMDFDNLCYGRTLTDSKRELLSLTRDDIATVFRSIQQTPLNDRVESIVLRFKDMLPGKAVAAVLVLKELELLTATKTDNLRKLTIKPDSIKKELNSSRTFGLLGT
ncbi:MAG: single-stranded-DNA-specific exonuclease RecJ [Oscillospiraceae bacterium]|nr:single-stranded-DNA-specific exonuclease RecJ [Oscillospiraceae bacterium]